jgi:hypothetical protein
MSLSKIFIFISEQTFSNFGRLDSFRAINENVYSNKERQLFFASFYPTLGASGGSRGTQTLALRMMRQVIHPCAITVGQVKVSFGIRTIVEKCTFLLSYQFNLILFKILS